MSVVDDTPPIPATTSSDPHPFAPLGEVVVACRDAAAGFGAAPIIDQISLEVRAGETVAIVGRSGCGKTTLLHLLAGLLPASSGIVDAQPAALMPQRDGLMPWASARDNAALPLRVAGVPRREARAIASGQLAALGLADATTQRVASLSGGMRQRVALARTLLTGRELILLDEPLAAVDALTRSELHTVLLDHLARDGHGAVLVTHDLDEAALLADRILILGPSAGPGSATTLHAGPPLIGERGQRLEHRGGNAMRGALLEALAS